MKHLVKSAEVNICLISKIWDAILHSSDNFIQNGLKQADASLPLFYSFGFEYAIGMIQDDKAGLKWNGTHQLLAYADDVNLLGDNTNATYINRITIWLRGG
jgi:hypothetical protein